MPAERCFVGAVVNGSDQFYQRDIEVRDGTKYVAKPYFVLNRSEATTMSEVAAKIFVARLRSLKVSSAFIEDARDGRRIEFKTEAAQSGKDNRTEVAATLDDENSPQARWYVVKPICRPDGRKWFIRIDVPGIAEPQVLYADDALGVLQRAEDMNFLQYAAKYDRPQPQQAPATRNSSVVRRRPGDRQ